MRNLKGELLTKKFNYSRITKPRIIYYCYGAIVIARRIKCVDKKGDLIVGYELASKDISKDIALKNSLLNNDNQDELDIILDNYMSDEEFNLLERRIEKHFLDIL